MAATVDRKSRSKATAPTSHTITLKKDAARWFVDAALSSMSKDEVTPVICAARIRVTDLQAQILCTDRYRVTLTTATVEESTGDHEYIIPREAVDWLRRNLNHFGRYLADFQRVTIEVGEEVPPPAHRRLRVAVHDTATDENRSSLVWEGYATRGNFPPVDGLFEDARKAEVSTLPTRINVAFLGALKSLNRVYAPPPILKLTVGKNPHKPGLLLATFTDDDREVYAEVLIQPNLLAG